MHRRSPSAGTPDRPFGGDVQAGAEDPNATCRRLAPADAHIGQTARPRPGFLGGVCAVKPSGLVGLLGLVNRLVELALFGRARERGGRAGRVHGGGDPVEVACADLALVLRRGVTTLLGGELTLLQL